MMTKSKKTSKWTKHLFVIGMVILMGVADSLGNGTPGLNMFLAVLPALVLAVYIYQSDDNPEPFGKVLKVYAWGLLTAPVVLVLHAIFEGMGIELGGTPLRDAFLSASLVEEGVKFFFFMLLVWKMPDFDEPFDAVVYSCLIALAFATVENILYVAEGGLGVSIMRAFLAVPGHFLDGIFMGYFLAKAKFKNKLYIVMAFIAPFITHGLYDFILMFSDTLNVETFKVIIMIGFLYFDYFLWVYSLKLLRRLSIENDAYHFNSQFSKAIDNNDTTNNDND